jgi:hypothetical protein
LELIQAIEASKYAEKVQPILIVLSNSLESGGSVLGPPEDHLDDNNMRQPSGIGFLNEPLSIFNTLAVSGKHNTDVHKHAVISHLKRHYKSHLYYIEFDLKASSDEIPMNWVLSPNSFGRIEQKCKQLTNHIPKIVFPNTLKASEMKPEAEQVSPIKTNAVEVAAKQVPNETNISIATHPHLYYYSHKRKMWRRKTEADFNLSKMKPLGKKFKTRKRSKKK